MRIWKFALAVTDVQIIQLPAGAQILTVQEQGDEPQLWALCDERSVAESRAIAIYGTGNPMPSTPGRYISTFQMRGGALVLHAFEVAAK